MLALGGLCGDLAHEILYDLACDDQSHHRRDERSRAGDVAASDTDLVFAFVSEEWGLILAILMVACIVILACFVVRSAPAGRSCFYTIGACAAVTVMVTQTILNVFGMADFLPLTGVTFPFVSNGGSSMLCVWGLLAFVKAADTRQNASFAIRLPGRKGA